jgi:hypothetical protein
MNHARTGQKTEKWKQKTQEENDLFDDMFFWLTLATTDYSWLFESSKDAESKIGKNGGGSKN